MAMDHAYYMCKLRIRRAEEAIAAFNPRWHTNEYLDDHHAEHLAAIAATERYADEHYRNLPGPAVSDAVGLDW